MNNIWQSVAGLKQEALGLTVTSDDRLDPPGHRKFLEAEMVRWSRVIKDTGEYAD
eukprot:gene41315-54757_t